MNATAVKALMAEIAPVIRDYVDGAAEQMAAAFADASKELVDRATALENENKDLQERVRYLESKTVEIDLTPVEKLVRAEIAKLPPPPEVNVEAIVSVVIENLPVPEKGEPGDPGKDVDPEQVREMIAEEVEKAIAAIPVPKDGKDGKDAIGFADAVKDNGELVIVRQDGSLLRTGICDGKDGASGLGWEDFDVEVINERSFAFRLQRGERVEKYEITIPAMIDAGVYKEGISYARGDAVSWGGSLWVAQKDTSTKPDTPNSDWRLAVKRGRDGKDFTPKDQA